MTPTAVFDTVALLQAGGKPHGPAGACFRLVTEDKLILFATAEGLEELEDVLSREKIRRRFPLLTAEHVDTFLHGLRARAQIMDDVPVVFHYSRDPDDEHLLNLAIATRVQYLVTRDKDLLDLMKEDNPDGHAFRQLCPDVKILDPVALLAAINQTSDPAQEGGSP